MDKCIHELFEEQAQRTPDKVAVVFENERLTYRDLNDCANQLARHLRALGVGPETITAICIKRSLNMVIGILGILKAGGAWLPLDPIYPKDRQELILGEAQISVLLIDGSLTSEPPQHQAKTLILDGKWGLISHESKANLNKSAAPENLAYVIYTSGSTGRPKAVMISDESLVHYVDALVEPFMLTANDIYLHTATFSFSSSVRQLMLPLTHGATIVIAPVEKIQHPIELFEMIKQENVTTIDLVPSYFRNCIDALADLNIEARNALLDNDLRLILTASESLAPDLPTKWSIGLGQSSQLINMFGQTETTGIVSVYPISIPNYSESRPVPIGRPIANTEIYVLDAQLASVPHGEVGEIYISGPGLSRGYLNQPEFTALRLVPNPFSNEIGGRLYRTGDLGRVLPDGNIECVGRTDQQVKIRGFRVELGEIEAALGHHESLRQTVIIAREDLPGDNRLLAYVVAYPGQTPNTADLRSFLSKQLPDYMIPSRFVLLESLPLTATGKLNRNALPAPQQVQSSMRTPFVAPRTEIEKMLCSVWSQLLKFDDIGVHDNFFELGGHSLLAAQVVSRVRNASQLELPLPTVFELPTVALLAERIETIHWATKNQKLRTVSTDTYNTQGDL